MTSEQYVGYITGENFGFDPTTLHIARQWCRASWAEGYRQGIEQWPKTVYKDATDKFVDSLLTKIRERGHDISDCDGDEDPAEIIANWLHGRIYNDLAIYDMTGFCPSCKADGTLLASLDGGLRIWKCTECGFTTERTWKG